MSDYGSDYGLANLENGVVPVTRLEKATTAQNMVQSLGNADTKRDKKRAKVDGLVDGNPPYNSGRLKEAGRGDAANFNDGSGRAFLESGASAFYDLVTEAPGFVQISTSYGNEENRVEWSRELSSQADLLFLENKPWDSQFQTSITEMVLHGTGPMFFDDAHVPFPRAIATEDLLVPDRQVSDVDRWQQAVILFEYYPPELFQRIENEKAAAAVGWNVAHTKLVIEHAMDEKQPANRTANWSWFQNELKSNSFDYTDQQRVCKLAHVFWREFDGRVSHGIVERNDTSGVGTQWLFRNIGRYDSFYQVIHPMYFDKGRAGLHHNVTGLGVKMYSLMEFLMRLHNNLMDKTFAPKTLFKPSTAEAQTKFQLQRMGDWAMLSPGVDVMQAPIQGFLQDGLTMYRTSSELMQSNLSQYRQHVPAEGPGNPPTKYQKQLEAAQQSALSNTTFNRYYKQLDLLYAEVVRRLCNLNSTDRRAQDFQKRCMAAGVPKECFGRIESVNAIRVLGGGSHVMRRENLASIGQVIVRCNEEGQNNWVNDVIAANVGQNGVKRYNARSRVSQLESDQRERAANQIAAAKIGMAPTPSPSQNPLIFATSFLQAAIQAVSTIQQGGDPRQVVAFVNALGPAIHYHIQRLSRDAMRQPVAKELEKQANRLAQMIDKLSAKLQAQAKQQQQQRGKTQAVLSDLQLKNLETRAKIQDRAVKTKFSLAERAAKHRQQLAIADATAGSQLALNHFRTLNE